MTTPPPRGIQPLQHTSADQIKAPKYPTPNSTAPVADRDINYGYPTNDQDFAQLFTQLGPNGVNALHTRADTDAHPYAVHHTLGTSRNQAAQGDHIHDGATSKLLGTGMGLSISGAQIGNPALASLIAMLKNVMQFTDATTSGDADTWHPASLGTNWVTSSTFNGLSGYAALAYKKLVTNDVSIIGAFKAGSTAPGNPVFMLPVGYRPSAGAWPISAQQNNAGTVNMGHAYVSTSGNVDLFFAAGVGINANAEYLMWGTVPL